MTAYQSPFQFGTLATEDNFIDRIEDRALLKQLLSSHINVMFISPRRWGKSSLAKKAMTELSVEDKDVRVCYIDAFSIGSEAEFYRMFASQVIACASDLKFVPQERDKMTILQLPEMLAKEKGFKIIVCIDEFRQSILPFRTSDIHAEDSQGALDSIYPTIFRENRQVHFH